MMQAAETTVVQDKSQENELRAMFVRKGLTLCFIILHTLMVSAGTSSMIKCLRSNPNFDVQNSGNVH